MPHAPDPIQRYPKGLLTLKALTSPHTSCHLFCPLTAPLCYVTLHTLPNTHTQTPTPLPVAPPPISPSGRRLRAVAARAPVQRRRGAIALVLPLPNGQPAAQPERRQ
eukprot:6204763-Pleurochrysis_carterae.AAC.1